MAGGGAMGGAPTATVGNPQAQGGMGGGMPQQAPQQATQQRVMSPLVQQQIMRQQAPVGAPRPADLTMATTPAPQTMAPFQQQMMRQQAPQQMYNPYQMQPQQMSGLQAALMQMLGQYNQPMARPQIQQMQQMPQYQNRALQYRPNLGLAQQNLSRVAPSVQKQAQDRAAAEAAAAALSEEDDAGFRAWQRQQYEASKNQNFGGG